MDISAMQRWRDETEVPFLSPGSLGGQGQVVAAKVPLTGESVWNEKVLAESVEAQFGKRPGLILDINCASRYCSEQSFALMKIPYRKIGIPGKPQQSCGAGQSFGNLVEEDPEDELPLSQWAPEIVYINKAVFVIGQHAKAMQNNPALGPLVIYCKTGLNRTGYVLAHYLMRISQGALTPQAALAKFYQARGVAAHVVIKDGFRRRLLEYYTPGTDWLQLSLNNGLSAIRSPTVSAAVRQTLQQAFPWEQGEEIAEEEEVEILDLLAAMVPTVRGGSGRWDARKRKRTRPFSGIMPATLGDEDICKLSARSVLSTGKSDGERIITVYLGSWGLFLVSRGGTVRRLRGPTAHISSESCQMMILDGEMVEGAAGDGWTLCAFDMIALDWLSWCRFPFEERLTDMAKTLHREWDVLSTCPIPISTKRFFRGYPVDAGLDHKNDGRIIYMANEQYQLGKQGLVYKHKPAKMNTVDFNVRVRTDGHESPRYVLTLSKRGRASDGSTVVLEDEVGTDVTFRPSPTVPIPEGRTVVVECAPDFGPAGAPRDQCASAPCPQLEVWVAERLRPGKPANTRHTYESAKRAYLSPIDEGRLSRLINGPRDALATVTDAPTSRKATFTLFHSGIKRLVFTTQVYPLRGKKQRLLDFGCGKAPCINSWAKALAIDAVSTVTAYDPDAKMTAEAGRRVKSIIGAKFRVDQLCDRFDFVNELCPTEAAANRFYFVMVNFSGHYLFQSHDDAVVQGELKKLMDKVAPGGLLSMTIPDGGRIWDLLAANGGEHEGVHVRIFSADPAAALAAGPDGGLGSTGRRFPGQFVNFSLSGRTAFYRDGPRPSEPLADTKWMVQQILARKDFGIVHNVPFDEIYRNYTKYPISCGNMTKDDMEVSRLYRLIVFRKL